MRLFYFHGCTLCFSEAMWPVILQQMLVEADMRSLLSSIKSDMKVIYRSVKQCLCSCYMFTIFVLENTLFFIKIFMLMFNSVLKFLSFNL